MYRGNEDLVGRIKTNLKRDIALNPGPRVNNGGTESQVSSSKSIKPPKCPSCEKTVQRNHMRYLCSICLICFMQNALALA